MERGPDDGGGGGGGGGGGTAGPSPLDILRDRVEKLEAGQAAILAKLEAILAAIAEARLENEKRFGGFDVSLTKLEERITHTATTADLSSEHNDLNRRIATIDGRLSSIPTTVQTVGMIVAMLAGLTGAAYTLSKVTEPPRQSPIVMPAPAPASPAITAPAAPIPALPAPKAP